MRLRLELDSDTTSRLIEQATVERRPVAWHAEVLLRRALGLPFPLTEPDNLMSEDIEAQACGPAQARSRRDRSALAPQPTARQSPVASGLRH